LTIRLFYVIINITGGKMDKQIKKDLDARISKMNETERKQYIVDSLQELEAFAQETKCKRHKFKV